MMKSVLEELYNGNICPEGRFHAKNSPFGRAARIRYDALETLMSGFNDDEKETFSKYTGAQGEIEDIMRFDTFTYALRFGILLMIELFMDKDPGVDYSPGVMEATDNE